MKEFTYTIKDEQGIHARPAGELVKAASAYPCKVTISKDGKEVDAKRILGVMGLGVKCGQEIVLKDGWRSGRGSNRSTWQILRGETVRNRSGNRLRRMNQQKDEVTL